MAGPQDYLTVQGPSPASYSLPKFDLGSQIAQIPTSYQEGQQYGVKRGLQTAFQDGFPTDQNGNPDYLAMAKRMLQIAGPEAAQPYFQMGLQQGNAEGNQALLSGQPPGQPQGMPQTYRPAPNAPNSATGPDGIRGPSTASTGGGSIFPYTPGTSPPQIVGGGPAPQPQGGAGLQGQPAPFAGTRDQQGAPPGPVGGGTPAFNDRVAQYGGMSNRPSVTEDGTTGQPTAPTSSRETANNGQQDRRIVAADRLDAQAALLQAQAARYGQSPAAVKTLQDRAQQLADQAKQYREAALKDTEATPEQKNLRSGAAAGTQLQKQTIEQSQKTYGGINAAAAQYDRELKPVLSVSQGILSDPRAYTGIGANAVLDLNKVKAVFGDPHPAVLQEALKKASAVGVLGQINGLKDSMQEAGGASSRLFKQQADLMEAASPSLENTPAGNRFLVHMSIKAGEMARELADQARNYKASHGGILDDGFDKQMAAYIAKNPIITKAEASNPAILGAPDLPASMAGKPDQQAAWKAAMGLKSGDPYRVPSSPTGEVRYVK